MALTALPVNQLLFAGDNILFFKADKEGAKEVYHLLESYAKLLARGVKILLFSLARVVQEMKY